MPSSFVPPLQRADIRCYTLLCLLLPLAFGLLSLLLGQDRNWDLRNYHLYNAYAWLNGRADRDLAAAGMQGYFNPLLDLPYLWLNRWLSPPWIGFMMGWLQGLNFILLLGIARRLLPRTSSMCTITVLALSGCLMAGFLSELGNTMGDNVTALFVLAAVLLILPCAYSPDKNQNVNVLVAGLLVGLGIGLKLTNAIYAVGLVGALLCQRSVHGAVRLQAAVLFGLATAAGLAITSGYWFWHLWSNYGNPLFPQFGALFPNPLTTRISVADVSHLPRSVLEWLLWPLLITLDPYRVGELAVRQLAWPALYLLFACRVVRHVWMRLRGATVTALDPATRFLACFVGLSFVVWTGLFSISRYLVAIELLAPLLSWLLIHALIPTRQAGWIARGVVATMVLLGLPSYLVNWGHAGWADPAFTLDSPVITASDAAHGSVLLVGQDLPQGWLATLLPSSLVFVGIDNSFPAGAGFDTKVHELIMQRGGLLWAVLPARTLRWQGYMTRLNRIAGRLGFSDDARGCHRLANWQRQLHLRAQLEFASDGRHCTFTLRAEDRFDLIQQDQAATQHMADRLRVHGIVLNPTSCQRHTAAIGDQPYPYQWCDAKLASD